MASLSDVVFAIFTKVYTSADPSKECEKNTLVVTGNKLWYLRFHQDKLVIDAKPAMLGPVSNERWKESPIKTYDELIFRVHSIQLLGGI
jgi:hypothetical protein